VIHALIAQDAKGAVTKCGRTVPKKEATVWWRTDCTCEDCLAVIGRKP